VERKPLARRALKEEFVKLIKLTGSDGEEVWINPEKVVGVIGAPHGTGTQVEFDDGVLRSVREKPEEVVKAFEGD
jgi:uncharacterized protein YlzI (FlbEa/FlbD family)